MLDKWTIITDPGVDDLIALVLLNKLSRNKSHSLIATFGNVALEFTDQNTREFISLVTPHWSYFKGSELPISGKRTIAWGDSFHGQDGTWGVHIGNHQKVKSLRGYPNNKNIISLGPLTDLVKLQENLSLESVTIMGGVFNARGNETEYSEFNIASDPESAYSFFNHAGNTRVKIVPLDVANKVRWSLKQVKSIPESNKVNIWLKKLLVTWFSNYKNGKADYFELFDPLTVYLHFNSEKALWKKSGIMVRLKGREKGRTVFSDRNSQCEIALDIYDKTNVANQIFKLLFQ